MCDEESVLPTVHRASSIGPSPSGGPQESHVHQRQRAHRLLHAVQQEGHRGEIQLSLARVLQVLEKPETETHHSGPTKRTVFESFTASLILNIWDFSTTSRHDMICADWRKQRFSGATGGLRSHGFRTETSDVASSNSQQASSNTLQTTDPATVANQARRVSSVFHHF